MRRTLLLAVVLAVALVAAVGHPVAGAQDPDELPVLELFWAEGCPYCEAERGWLPTLEERYPELRVEQYEVSRDPANRELLSQRAAEHGVEVRGVPMTFFADRHWVGFDANQAARIQAAVEDAVRASEESGSETPAPDETSPPSDATVDVPVVGEVDLERTSLVAATLLVGALDGINPCSLWVLSVLLALVLHTGSRRRVLAVGATFLVVTAGLYALYVGGLYSVLSYLSYLTWIRVALASVAAVFGIIAIKDFFAWGRGLSLSIPESRKPAIYRRMRQVAAADRPLLPVLGGTAAMAVGVSLVETPCTAGFPLVWSNLLSSQGVGGAEAAGLFGLYMIVFLIDELLIFGAAVLTMRAMKVQERHGRLLKLIGGVVMLTLAGTMIVAPDLLEDLAGTLLVFGAAAAVTTLIALTYHPRRVERPPRPA